LEELRPQVAEYATRYARFVEESKSGRAEDLSASKMELGALSAQLRGRADQTFAEIDGIEPSERANWLSENRPFHWFIEFPDVMDAGGFDVIVGNPPYIRDRNMSAEVRRQVSSYQSGGCPDLYATCYERSLSLLNPGSGRHAFIVALSLSFGIRFSVARQLISETLPVTWWSTYAVWPASLFSGVRIRNTIVVGSGAGGAAGRWATKHNVFSGEKRKSLFATLEFHPSRSIGGEPVAREGLGARVLAPLERAGEFSGRSVDKQVYVRPTAQYWLPALRRRPPVLTADGEVLAEQDDQVMALSLFESEDEDVCFAILAGKVGYLAWSAIGDDFHVKESETVLARRVQLLIRDFSGGKELAQQVWGAGLKNAFVSKNNDGYVNVRWSAARRGTDVFDKWLLKAAGLDSEWRSINVWYRQTMGSTRDNLNSRYLSAEEAQTHLGPS